MHRTREGLLLPDLMIKGFRGLRELSVPELGRVNLLTGKNSIGKTSVLEALWLYSQRGGNRAIRSSMAWRDELRMRPDGNAQIRRQDEDNAANNLRFLFHGRADLGPEVLPIVIGPSESEEQLRIELAYFRRVREEDPDEEGHFLHRNVRVERDVLDEYPEAEMYLLRSIGSTVNLRTPVERIFGTPSSSLKVGSSEIPCEFVRAGGLGKEEVARLWDAITLTDMEEEVLSALKLIIRDVQRISFVGESERPRRRFPIVKLESADQPLPLLSLGDGMRRIFALVLALTNATEGMLLIDEVETGLHYSVQADMWRLLFRLSKQLDVQIFAITHSLDCIRAFQQAAKDTPEVGALFRLQKRDSDIEATLFTEDDLEIATASDIEVR